MADPHPPEAPVNGEPAETLAPGPGSKRQRRPSVRLGDIGDQPHEPYVRRSKQWEILPSAAFSSEPRHRHPPPKDPIGKPFSMTRPRSHLRPDETLKFRSPPFSAAVEDRALVPVDENHEPLGAGIRRGSRDGMARRGGGATTTTSRRVRTNWVLKADEGAERAELRSSGGEDAGDEGYVEDSESLSDRDYKRAAARVRVSESRGFGPDADAMEGDAPSETDNRDWSNQNGRCRPLGDAGIRSWLNRLGLIRYASVFEIHEVDYDVLPLLTLEDLRDMGINAVGSRRKMYCAIQKLRKNIM